MKNLSWRKTASLLTVAFLLLTATPAPASAWGGEGHRIVARIAMRLLNPAARTRVAQLLGNNTLDSVALWADDIRGSFNGGARPETKLWHFADIPLGQQFDANARYCKRSPWGDCVVEALDRFNRVLLKDFTDFPADRLQYSNSEQEAVKFITHFVGDLHQPLHCADKDGDAGGNDRKVTWFGANMKLHGVWDSAILNRSMSNAGLGVPGYATRLHDDLTATQKDFARSTTPVTRADIIAWANQSHAVAAGGLYNGIAEDKNVTSTLNATYFNANRTKVDNQLKLAGIRLARMLNSVFD